MLIGLNVYVVNCRDGKLDAFPGSIYAYGGPIFYLVIQICFFFWFIFWLEGIHLVSFPRPKRSKGDTEREMHDIIQEIEDEKNRVETSESDLLRVLHLTKSFGSSVAVDDVSFGIGQGEIFAVLGPNGAGKSTVVNMIRGELAPDDGRILLQGIDIVKQRRLGQKYLGGKFGNTLRT
jgi:ABC-type multidrug transport system fused ATPase/permease subunit